MQTGRHLPSNLRDSNCFKIGKLRPRGRGRGVSASAAPRRGSAPGGAGAGRGSRCARYTEAGRRRAGPGGGRGPGAHGSAAPAPASPARLRGCGPALQCSPPRGLGDRPHASVSQPRAGSSVLVPEAPPSRLARLRRPPRPRPSHRSVHPWRNAEARWRDGRSRGPALPLGLRPRRPSAGLRCRGERGERPAEPGHLGRGGAAWSNV